MRKTSFNKSQLPQATANQSELAKGKKPPLIEQINQKRLQELRELLLHPAKEHNGETALRERSSDVVYFAVLLKDSDAKIRQMAASSLGFAAQGRLEWVQNKHEHVDGVDTTPIMSALADALKDPDEKVIGSTAWALIFIAEQGADISPTIDNLVQVLKGDCDIARSSAADALKNAIINPKSHMRALNALIKVLEETDVKTNAEHYARARAAWALSEIYERAYLRPALPVLGKVIKEVHANVGAERDTAFPAASTISSIARGRNSEIIAPILPDLVEALGIWGAGDSSTAGAICWALENALKNKKIQDQTMKLLLKKAMHRNIRAKLGIAHVFELAAKERTDISQAIPWLKTMLRAKNIDLRVQAADALTEAIVYQDTTKCGCQVINALNDVIKHGAIHAKKAAVVSLLEAIDMVNRYQNSGEGLELDLLPFAIALAFALKSRSKEVRECASELLNNIPSEIAKNKKIASIVIPALVNALKDKHIPVRINVTRALIAIARKPGKVKFSELAAANLLTDPDEQVRCNIREAMLRSARTKTEQQTMLGLFVNALTYPDYKIKNSAMLALADAAKKGLDIAVAMPLVAELLKYSNSQLWESGSTLLRHAAEKTDISCAIPALVARLKSDPTKSMFDEHYAIEAAAKNKKTSTQIISALISMAEDENEEIKKLGTALLKACGREDIDISFAIPIITRPLTGNDKTKWGAIVNTLESLVKGHAETRKAIIKELIHFMNSKAFMREVECNTKTYEGIIGHCTKILLAAKEAEDAVDTTGIRLVETN